MSRFATDHARAGRHYGDSDPTGVRVWLATGHTECGVAFRSGSRVQEVLKRDAMGGGLLFCSGANRGDS